MTRALTLHQPWASLIAVGAKTIETRSWSTSYRGPLLIHAGSELHPRDGGGWPGLDLIRAAGYPIDGRPIGSALPFGAIVASCTLIDVVPMWSWSSLNGAAVTAVLCDGEHFGDAGGVLLRDVAGAKGTPLPPSDHFEDGCRNITDQLPFGDFAPGRFAWLLDDVKPTTERCPRCWESPVWPGLKVSGALGCKLCAGDGAREAVPARGYQGLWKWPPDLEAAG